MSLLEVVTCTFFSVTLSRTLKLWSDKFHEAFKSYFEKKWKVKKSILRVFLCLLITFSFSGQESENARL